MAVTRGRHLRPGVTKRDPWWHAVEALHSMMKVSSELREIPESNENHMAVSKVLSKEISNLAAALNQIRRLEGK